MNDDQKTTRGGAREGAGRKKLNKKAVGFYMKEETKQMLTEMATQKQRTLSDVIEEAIILLYNKKGRK